MDQEITVYYFGVPLGSCFTCGQPYVILIRVGSPKNYFNIPSGFQTKNIVFNEVWSFINIIMRLNKTL